MTIPKRGDINKFDDNNLPMLKNILDDMAKETERTIFVSAVPTSADLEMGTKALYDDGAGTIRLYYITSKGNLAHITLST